MLNQSNRSHALAIAAGMGAFLALAVGEAKEPSHTISGIETRVQGKDREVRIRTSKKATVSVFKLTEPFRILVDVSDARLAPDLALPRAADGVIAAVSAQALTAEASSIVRVEVVLTGPHEYEMNATSDGVALRIVGPELSSGEAKLSQLELGRMSAKREKDAVVFAVPLQGGKPAPEQVSIQHLENPNRIVVDLARAVAAPKWQTVKVGKNGIDKARLATSADGVRIVLDVAEQAPLPEVTVDAQARALVLRAAPAAKAAPVQPAPPAPVAEATKPEPAKALIEVTPEPEPAVVAAPVRATPAPKATRVAETAPASAQVTEARFEPKDGFYRLTLVIDGDAQLARDEGGSRRMPVLRLQNTQLPPDLVRTLDTSELTGDVLSTVSTYMDGPDTIIAARVGALTEHRHWRKDNRVLWDFRGKGDQAPAVSSSEVVGYPEEATAGFSSANQAARAAGELSAEQRRSRYTGRRISLDLKDAEIHNVLRLLADVSKLNIVASDDVKGRITLKLRNVPWDQALDIILTSKQLDKVRNGNIIRVAPIEVLEKEEQLRLARKEAMEKLEQLSVRLIAVSYASADEALKQVQGLLSARGRASIDKRTNVIIVEDIEEVLFKVERLVRTLDTQTPQVLIESRIVEAATSFSRALGIQWGGQVAFSPLYGNSTGLAFPNTFRMQGGGEDAQTPNGGVLPIGNGYAVNLPVGAGLGSGGTLGFLFGSANNAHLLSLRLSAAESEGKTKIISSPKVVTLDNRTAKIVSGERVPITVITANGPTTRFINADLSLEVTPHVTSDGGIQMKIKATKNELSQRTDILGTPGIITREAETEMLVQDGDTAVLGGIYKRNAVQTEAMVPFLGRIPVLGWLFKNRRRTDDREELLIFMSPRIVNRAEALVRSN